MDAIAREELEIEYWSKYDYESELWAAERESMANEGDQALWEEAAREQEELDRQLAAGEITKACHLIRSKRLEDSLPKS